MPQRKVQFPQLDLLATDIGSTALLSSPLHCLAPPSPSRQRSQTHPTDPVRISALPNSLSLFSGPGLSPPPPKRFRTLPQTVPAHLLGHQRSQSTPNFQSQGVRKVSANSRHQQNRSLPDLCLVPTILITTSPDLPRRKVTPQSPLHLRVHRRRNGSKQLRDRDHSHRPLRHPSVGRLCNLGRAEPSQHLRQEGARDGGRFGGGLMPQHYLFPSSPPPLELNKENMQPEEAAAEFATPSKSARSSMPPPLPERSPMRKIKPFGSNDTERITHNPIHVAVDVTSLPVHLLASGLPPTPPATPPLTLSNAKHHTRSQPQAVGTVAVNNRGTTPVIPPPFTSGESERGGRTVSGKLRWEDDRDSWF